MAILLVHQAKALKQVHEGSTNPGLMQELRTATDFATSQVQRRSRDFGGSPERPCLVRGDCCPPGKGCNRAGPSSWDEAGVLQPLLHCTQERWWPSTNPGSASLEPGFAQAPIQDAPHRGRMIKCIQPQDWFAAIDLKDAYFHVLILLRHRPFLRFAFEDRAWQYRVLPFGLSLSPRVFMKVVEGALTPIREVGIRVLNYLDHWFILAQSREQLCDHRDLGLRVNWEKSKLSPVQRISFLSVELDSVSMMACLTDECAFSSFRDRNVVPLKQMASAAAVTPLQLLHMRPLQHWLHSRVPRWAWCRGTVRVNITQQCHRSFSPWTDLAFLRAGVLLEQVSRHTVVTTNASSMGRGATCNGQAASGVWTGPRLLWHINCLELWAVHLTLRQFWLLRLSRTSTGWEVYDHTACHSLPAISSSGVTYSSNNCALSTSRGSSIVQPMCSHDSSRSPENGDSIPRWSGWSSEARVDRLKLGFASHESSQCPPQVCVSPSEPTRTDTVQAQGGRGAGPAGHAVLAHPDLVSRTNFPRDSPSLAAFLWGRTSSLRGSAPYGTRVQIYETSMCGSWTGRGRLERSTTGSGRDHHSG